MESRSPALLQRAGGICMEPDGQQPAPIINIAGEKVALGPLRRDLMPSARL
jgi:hypothetical protein